MCCQVGLTPINMPSHAWRRGSAADGSLRIPAGPGVAIDPPFIIPQGAILPNQTELVDHVASLRAHYGAPPLAWNVTIAAYVADFVSGCPGNGVGYVYSPAATYPNIIYGELLGLNDASFTEFIDGYFLQNQNYNFSAPGYQPAAYGFTELVWVSTQSFACAAELCAGWPLYVCDLYPPGNIDGEFVQNVLPAVTAG
jgi:hypothetical protein